MTKQTLSLRLYVFVGLVLLLMLGVAQAQKCDRDDDGFLKDSKKCAGLDCNDNDEFIYPNAMEVCDGVDNNCDGQVDEGCPGGGDATSATVSLTGAFVFDVAPTVTFDVKKSGSGVVAMGDQVTLSRPDDSDCPALPGDPPCSAAVWDDVFAGCPGLLKFPFPKDFTATSGNWKINFGFHQDDFPFAVRLVFIDITLEMDAEPSGINLQLMGEPDNNYVDNPIPPEDTTGDGVPDPSVFTLTHFWIWGNSGPPKPVRCNDEGTLPLRSPITLTITPTP